ncbi:type II secretion system protein [Cerasicoccus arenae]|uniref:Prepilin-type N-terminal cleavage/methylation domain-containing protein n=1 Tax=Cerasicoccus arenae TaxID=424488 RepID=A0A8J3GBE5_9BACT|nr:prepilin-type N-terminal cleavage/methylation domain-containing protein [Cerasicoccus arenae]MBK1856994.1 prepilin-type N-terminal cleavage/methylation domain-containing protein [Cerasicoccus arenae]GHB90287.1 hypothetical protein GCM10007047_01190 [Cerasicoccus arenae]
MTLSRKTRSRKGFTLVELLTVIAIIGILAALIIPAVGKVQESAKKSAAASNGRQIGLAYNTFANSGGKTRNITSGGTGDSALNAGDAGDYAFILAKYGGLNDASIWYIDSDDELADAIIPKTVMDATEESHQLVGPVSWDVIANLTKNAPTSTTPLAATRGTDGTNSTWDETSPWKGDGGHIIFLDGHVAWYDDLDLDPLLKYNSSEEANNLQEAVNDNAVVLKGKDI